MHRPLHVLLCTALLLHGVACASHDPDRRPPATGAEIAEEAGLGLGSFLVSAIYAPFKVAYAAGGLVAGGLAWIFSGADDEVARQVMEPALAGDYVITPTRLRRPETIEFVGRVDDASATTVATPQIASRTEIVKTELPAVSAPPPSSRRSTRIAAATDPRALLASGACRGTVNLSPIRFPLGRNELTRSVRRELDAIPTALERCTDSQVRIVGHADATGSEATNLSLSRARAEAVRDHIVSQGVSSDRVQIVAAGESRPTASNRTRTGRASNRRAEVSVVLR